MLQNSQSRGARLRRPEGLNDLTIIMGERSMNEPVMAVGRCRPPVLRRVALLVSALSLLGSAMLSAPVMAVAASTSDVIYSVESAKASKTLMLDVVHAGKRLVAVGDRGDRKSTRLNSSHS